MKDRTRDANTKTDERDTADDELRTTKQRPHRRAQTGSRVMSWPLAKPWTAHSGLKHKPGLLEPVSAPAAAVEPEAGEETHAGEEV